MAYGVDGISGSAPDRGISAAAVDTSAANRDEWVGNVATEVATYLPLSSTDPKRVDEVHRLFLKKYTSAWLLSFVGSSIGRGRPVEVIPWSVAEARP